MALTKLELINESLKLTNQMLASAEQQDWQQLEQLEQHRQQQLAMIFPVDESEVSADLEEKLQHLISLNQQLTDFCNEQKQSLQQELQVLTKNKQAINAYKSV